MQTVDNIHESFEEDVQYPFADVGEPILKHISAITQENRRSYTYTCPYCKKSLVPRLGSIAHCYAHKPGESCDQDRYIHTTAERLLKEKWDRDEPFEITMKVRTECKEKDNCFFYKDHIGNCVIEEKKTFNLKKQYSQCNVEKKYGEFIPDLCLIDDTGKHEPIFIEIWSKHKNSEKKAKSDYRIIEIRLKTAEDLENLPKRPITESSTVTFNHFKILRKSPEDCHPLNLMKYTLYADTLKSYVDEKTTTCVNFKSVHHSKSIFEMVCSPDEVFSKSNFQTLCNAFAIDRGFNIRNCYICQLYGEDTRVFNGIQPRLNGCHRDIDGIGLIQCKSEEAMTCRSFKLKDQPLKYMKSKYAHVSRYIWYKNADGSISEEGQKRQDYRINPDVKEEEIPQSVLDTLIMIPEFAEQL